MVYGLLVHSLDHRGVVWFSHFFTPEGNDTSKKDREQMVIGRVRIGAPPAPPGAGAAG